MTWLTSIEARADETAAVESAPRVRNYGTSIDLRSTPSPKLVIDIDCLEDRNSILGQYLYRQDNLIEHCDYVVIFEFANKSNIILIEAKSGNHFDKDRKKAYSQLVSSLEILDVLIQNCTLHLPFDSIGDCDVWAVCVMEALRGHRTSNADQKTALISFTDAIDVPFLCLTADRDIWRQIREQKI